MSADEISAALADISAERDPTLKHLKLASLVSAVFRERGIELVVVGGSAIEFYTEGAYVSGDVDMCLVPPSRIDLRTRQELMGLLGGKGGPRSWEVCGTYVDILGEVEHLSAAPFGKLEGPYGSIKLASAEELLVERVLVSVYPGPNEAARLCALKLAAAGLEEQVEIDWAEVRRLAERPEYGIFRELGALVSEAADELGKKSPYYSAR